MSPDPAPNVSYSATHLPIEHRSHRRYEMALDLLCKPAGSSDVYDGKTCDLSSRGVRFRVEKTFLPGTMLQINIRWPYLLANVCPLQLVISGRVTRSDWNGTVITAMRHEFRTVRVAAISRKSAANADSLVA